MEITCPNCQTKYNLDEDRISPEGSPVRCTRCQQVFTAHRPSDRPAPETPPEPAPEAPLEPAPEAPLEPAPEAPLEPAPEAPSEPAPEAPLEPAPETPLEPAPEAPPEPAPEAPPEAPLEGLSEELLEELRHEKPEAPPEPPPASPEAEPETGPQPDLFEMPPLSQPEEEEAEPLASQPPLPEREMDFEPAVSFDELTEGPPATVTREKRRGGWGGFVLWSLLWLVLLAGAVYGALVFVNQTKLFPRYIKPVRDNPTVMRAVSLIKRVPYLRYPFVDQGLERAVRGLIEGQIGAVPWLRRSLAPRPVPKAPPRIKARSELTIVNAQGRFVTQAQAGRLFVVEGKIKNIGQSPVSYIRLRGNLYIRDKRKQNVVFGRPVLAYAGVVFTSEDFKRLSLKGLRQRLNVRSGDDRTNYLLQPGHEVGFMIVFDKLPLKKRLSEYVVQIHSSAAGAKPQAGPPGPSR